MTAIHGGTSVHSFAAGPRCLSETSSRYAARSAISEPLNRGQEIFLICMVRNIAGPCFHRAATIAKDVILPAMDVRAGAPLDTRRGKRGNVCSQTLSALPHVTPFLEELHRDEVAHQPAHFLIAQRRRILRYAECMVPHGSGKVRQAVARGPALQSR